MIILAAVDNANGLLFNKRRVSQDRVLREEIARVSAGSVLRMDVYSARQFGDALPENAAVSEGFLDEAEDGDFCFVEDRNLMPYSDRIEAVYLYKWNRDYPSDFKLDFLPDENGFHMTVSEDFAGYSHEDITKEIWEK